MEDEDTSLVAHIRGYINDTSSSSSAAVYKVHKHPLHLNEKITGVIQGGRLALCNGCVQPISPPYYGCSQCTDCLLHKSCANLPSSIEHRALALVQKSFTNVPPSIKKEEQIHRLILRTNRNDLGFICNGCRRWCNGFSYRSKRGNLQLDVRCAFLPEFVTHKAHHKRHVLRLIANPDLFAQLDCCDSLPFAVPNFQYSCKSCDFLIHATCAGLPLSVRHKFDKHPLKLITTGPQNHLKERNSSNVDIETTEQDENFCEFCEKKIEKKHWYYGCAECNQSFHVNCIPAVGKMSKVKLPARLNVPCHPHPLTGIRLLTDVSRSYRCGHCGNMIKNLEDDIAFDCLDCDFTIDYRCARRNLRVKKGKGL